MGPSFISFPGRIKHEYLSLGLEQGLPNVVYVEKSVCCCCYMHAENDDDSTCGSETFQSHGDSHCMNWIDNGLCVCPDIVDLHIRAKGSNAY